MPGFRGLAAGPGSPRAATPTPLCCPAGRGGTARSAARGQGPAGTSGGGEAWRCCLWGSGKEGTRDGGPAHSPARLPASAAAGSAPPGHEPCPPEEGGGRPPREQCGRLFCRLSASFPDPPFHAPWPNRHRPGTQREEPPYLVLERKGKGYPQMPAALGHRPAVVGPHPAAVPSPAGRWRRRAAPRGGAQSGKQAPQVPVPPSRGLLLCARWEGGWGRWRRGKSAKRRKQRLF